MTKKNTVQKVYPTQIPTTLKPTTVQPTPIPTKLPSVNPSSAPSLIPSFEPSQTPTINPTNHPTTLLTHEILIYGPTFGLLGLFIIGVYFLISILCMLYVLSTKNVSKVVIFILSFIAIAIVFTLFVIGFLS